MRKTNIVVPLLLLAAILCTCAAWVGRNTDVFSPNPTAAASPTEAPKNSVQGTATIRPKSTVTPSPKAVEAANPKPTASPPPPPINVSGTVLKLEDGSITLKIKGEESISLSIDPKIYGECPPLPGDIVELKYLNSKSGAVAQSFILLATAMEAKLKAMDLPEKVGQLFLARCPSTEQAYSDVADYKLGGYILFGRDIEGENKKSLKTKISGYQKKAKIPLLIAIDEEGGTVNRLSYNKNFRAKPFSSPRELYEKGGTELVLSDLKEKAELLHSLGINLNLAPVADISTKQEDFMYDRSLGKSAAETSDYIREIIEESKKLNIGATLKHFPGYGNNGDTHSDTVFDKRPYKSFLKSDFLPFIAGIEAGADSILVSHNVVTSMDPKKPASLSKEVHRVLRDELNFKGVILTDDMNMDAVLPYADSSNSAVAALMAGNDMVLCDNYQSQIPAVIKAVESGKVSEEGIDDSVMRILRWKQNLGLL